MAAVSIYVGTGTKRAFASAADWPGWSRSGRTEPEAIDTLLATAPRYARAVTGFTVPDSVEVVARMEGGSDIDFGAPATRFPADGDPIGGDELGRHLAALTGCWHAFRATAAAASGADLRRGPRGGGRTLDRIVAHVSEAEAFYVSGVGGKAAPSSAEPLDALEEVHEAFLGAIHGRLAGTVADVGPRGGRRWPVRFAIRYTAWHALDHAWEIEDRLPA